MTILTTEQQTELLSILKKRFHNNMNRHEQIKWSDVEAKLMKQPEKMWSVHQMETTGGEPDVVSLEENQGMIMFVDCSAESPLGRRSLCYDEKALHERKKNPPSGSAEGIAKQIGIDILKHEQYEILQRMGNFDCKSSSWVQTPEHIRVLGGAIFCDRRYNTVFLYHNGSDSYYAARGFRGLLRV
ncbi:MAG: DUF4256 domain-containing protein [Bacilli bacterium]